MADFYGDGDGVQEPQPPTFVLVPINREAKRATEHVRNKYYQYPLDTNSNTFGLWISFADPDKPTYTLGRNETDIYLPEMRGGSRGPGSQISDLQASFQLQPDTGAVLLCDHSEHKNTETLSPSHGTSNHSGYTVKIRDNQRSVLVARGINPRVAFGRDKYYQFELHWHSPGLYSFSVDEQYVVGPRLSKTKKYLQGEKVGGGAYGVVWWAMDLTTGGLMAVKKFHNLSGKNLEFATREVANMFRINKNDSIKHVCGDPLFLTSPSCH